jgi:hypothetical protein
MPHELHELDGESVRRITQIYGKLPPLGDALEPQKISIAIIIKGGFHFFLNSNPFIKMNLFCQ